MSQQLASASSAITAGKTSPDPMVFHHMILLNMTTRPDVDWSFVAESAGYNSAKTAKERFCQMKGKFKKNQSGHPHCPSRPEHKEMKENGHTRSSTNRSSSKVVKSMKQVRLKQKPIRGRKCSGGKPGIKRVVDAAEETGAETSDGSFPDLDDEIDMN